MIVILVLHYNLRYNFGPKMLQKKLFHRDCESNRSDRIRIHPKPQI